MTNPAGPINPVLLPLYQHADWGQPRYNLPQMPDIEIDGRSLYYVEAGATPGEPTLLLLHGAGGTHRVWPRAVRETAGARTLAVDLPGHGLSRQPGRRAVDAYAAVIEQFVAAFAPRRLVVAGHSMGSAIALTLVLRDRIAVDGLLLLGAAARMPVGDVLLGGSLASLEGAADFIAEHGFAAPAPDAQAGVRRQILETGATTTFGDFLACSRFDIQSRLPGISVPVRIIAGDKDRLTPLRFAQSLANGLPDARLTIVEQAGHFTMLEQPDRIAHLIGGYLSEFRSRHRQD